MSSVMQNPRIFEIIQSDKMEKKPKLLVFSTVFPNKNQPSYGIFVQNRMFHVGKKLPVKIVAPVPWFPLQGLIRYWVPHFRPSVPQFEIRDGFEIYHPKFLSIPALFKFLDGFFLAWGCRRLLRKIQRSYDFDIIDGHFGYPDGVAAARLAKWFKKPVTLTLRGNETRHMAYSIQKKQVLEAISQADQVFSVSAALRQEIIALGADSKKIKTVGNGIDIELFYPVDGHPIRQQLRVSKQARVIITIGGLIERKGFHRVMEVLPALKQHYPDLHYLIIGKGGSSEGDWTRRLEQRVIDLKLEDTVHFLGHKNHHELKDYLSAADLFVLATRREGWANVLLEAMACGLPVVTTDVGGNKEVVNHSDLGIVVPFNDAQKLQQAISDGLDKTWDRSIIINYARANSWNNRVETLVDIFENLTTDK